ncbi:MAG TPA: GNAT family N-acetyltransferase [Roseiflexaceae bacterium]|nr:GNAT family N-acetyltransferase [Roseiflexaceae bacterium]
MASQFEAGLPELTGYPWRALRPDDGPALAALAAASGLPPNNESARLAREVAALADNSRCAAAPDGAILAFAWVTIDNSMAHERRAFFQGGVHPACYGQGLGDAVLDWMEQRARQIFDAANDPRPAVMRIDVTHQNERAFEVYRRHGFLLALAEDELVYDLAAPPPELPLPDGLDLVSWDATHAPLFYRAYHASFQERPGFPGWDEPTWRANLIGQGDFWPDHSLLLLDRGAPVGFAICAADETDPTIGWIVQLGICPAWRGRGFAGALLAALLQRFCASGLRAAHLTVNTNNPRAIHVYQRVGFRLARRRSSYRKPLAPSP